LLLFCLEALVVWPYGYIGLIVIAWPVAAILALAAAWYWRRAETAKKACVQEEVP